MDVIAMSARFKLFLLLAIAALHMAVGAVHISAHVLARVQVTHFQFLFILLVITLAPLVAIYIVWHDNTKKGTAVYAVSMLASFLFGYAYHFVINSPDLCSNVVGQYEALFFYSALGLAIVEGTGFLTGAYLWLVDKNGAGCELPTYRRS